MYYLHQLKKILSTSPSIELPQTWAPVICGVWLEVYLSELEEEIILYIYDKLGKSIIIYYSKVQKIL